MERPRSPYGELTTRDNLDILGTLNPALWSAWQRAEARADFFELPWAKEWLHTGAFRTGAINGDQRRDLKEAVQGQKAPTVALGLTPVPNGHNGVQHKEVVRPRI